MNKRDEQSGLILLVEDNRGISEMVGEFLERRESARNDGSSEAILKEGPKVDS